MHFGYTVHIRTYYKDNTYTRNASPRVGQFEFRPSAVALLMELVSEWLQRMQFEVVLCGSPLDVKASTVWTLWMFDVWRFLDQMLATTEIS